MVGVVLVPVPARISKGARGAGRCRLVGAALLQMQRRKPRRTGLADATWRGLSGARRSRDGGRARPRWRTRRRPRQREQRRARRELELEPSPGRGRTGLRAAARREKWPSWRRNDHGPGAIEGSRVCRCVVRGAWWVRRARAAWGNLGDVGRTRTRTRTRQGRGGPCCFEPEGVNSTTLRQTEHARCPLCLKQKLSAREQARVIILLRGRDGAGENAAERLRCSTEWCRRRLKSRPTLDVVISSARVRPRIQRVVHCTHHCTHPLLAAALHHCSRCTRSGLGCWALWPGRLRWCFGLDPPCPKQQNKWVQPRHCLSRRRLSLSRNLPRSWRISNT